MFHRIYTQRNWIMETNELRKTVLA